MSPNVTNLFIQKKGTFLLFTSNNKTIIVNEIFEKME